MVNPEPAAIRLGWQLWLYYLPQLVGHHLLNHKSKPNGGGPAVIFGGRELAESVRARNLGALG
jgi:hypothetical protein